MDIIERISNEISAGRLAPGARLPTEQELMEAMGVSRTVVREAVAALKADGLVVTRQGSGAFVSRDSTRIPFRIDTEALASIAAVIDLLELRMAIEIEAAALAAERGSAKAIKSIDKALIAIDSAMAAGDAAIAEDFAFHQAISNATGNPLYRNFLTFLGWHLIPRQNVRTALASGNKQASYLAILQREHRDVADAIRERDRTGARQAMRKHLENSLDRYRRLSATGSSKQ
jgi:DNA-binding FadR family transcriptional regulator